MKTGNGTRERAGCPVVVRLGLPETSGLGDNRYSPSGDRASGNKHIGVELGHAELEDHSIYPEVNWKELE